MDCNEEILDAIEIMIDNSQKQSTKIYRGFVKEITSPTTCIMSVNDGEYQCEFYGGLPIVGSYQQVFVPFNNWAKAFVVIYDAPTVVQITMPTASWVLIDNLYMQQVSVPNATANSKIDIQPSGGIITQLTNDSVKALYILNSNGVFFACAVGATPSVDLTVQATITEIKP